MCNKELLVSYLYDDLSDRDRAVLESHLHACEPCRDELEALRDVRVDLATWAPPLPELGFRIVRKSAPAAQTWRAWWTPAAGLAAAAVLVLAAAAAIAHIEVHRGSDGVTVRTGWSAFPSQPSPLGSGGTSRSATVAVDGMGPNSGRDVRLSSAPSIDPATAKEILRRVDALEASMRSAAAVRNASTLSTRSSDANLIKVVRDLLTQSESKQKSELALRLSQVIHDFDAQRSADLARIQQGLGRIDAITTAEAAAHRDLANYIFTSARQK